MPSVLVIGAGPAGLAIAAALKKETSLSCELVDAQGVIGGSYTRLHPEIQLASPTSLTRLPGPVDVVDSEYVTIGAYAEYLARYAEEAQLVVRSCKVKSVVQRAGQWWMVDDDAREFGPYVAVVCATGMVSFPRSPDLQVDGDITMPIFHSTQWRGPDPDWNTVVIVGAGTSAVELAEACVAASVDVVMSTRKGKVKTLPKALLGQDLHYFLGPLEALPKFAFKRYCKTYPTVLATDLGFWDGVKRGAITIRGPISSVTAEGVHFKRGRTVFADACIYATGYEYRVAYLPASVAKYPHMPKTNTYGESISHPGLYFLGMPCVQGVSSEFLRGIAKDTPKLCARLKSLYQQA